MKEVFHNFLGADLVGMAPYKWAMTGLFSILLLFSLYVAWKKGFRDIDIISLLLIFIILFRSSYPLYIDNLSSDRTLRVLFLLLPVGMTVLIHFLYTKHGNFRNEQLIVGFVTLFIIAINFALGRAITRDSVHWWDESYRLIVINQVWLLGAILFSISIIIRSRKGSSSYAWFLIVMNVGLIIYLFGYLLLSISTTKEMYWIMWYHRFVSDILMVYAYSYLIYKLYRTLGRTPMGDGLIPAKLDIIDIMDKVPSDKLIHFLELNHPGYITSTVLRLTPRQQLQTILMINKISIKESAEYTFITPGSVKVYRSRIRKILN